MSNWSVSNGEFTQIFANHLWSDLDVVEHLAVVDTDDGADHLGDDYHVSQVGLDDWRLLVRLGSQLGGSQFVDQTHRLGSQASGESSSDSGGAQLGEFLGWHFQQVFQVDTFLKRDYSKMKYLAAYLLLVQGGNASPSASDISSLLAAASVEVDESRISALLAELEGKDVNDLIAQGNTKLASVPSGGAAASSSSGAAAGGAAEEAAAEEKEEESKEESDDDMGFGLFD